MKEARNQSQRKSCFT